MKTFWNFFLASSGGKLAQLVVIISTCENIDKPGTNLYLRIVYRQVSGAFQHGGAYPLPSSNLSVAIIRQSIRHNFSPNLGLYHHSLDRYMKN